MLRQRAMKLAGSSTLALLALLGLTTNEKGNNANEQHGKKGMNVTL